ncbi:LysR family transcriptional regulator [Companilactobacillus ginsenosidimutans]|uniref:Malolactic fermentation transcriptional regulator n=1 Tax=Companilactobacillus ginsenosidimutans TaxID=1007676 RepID=A0A0H4QHJ8_9LACO|nr:LysR family transcriptional regulator [Companilactobacillus ginsenosidimutans]AKP66491.1 malolactic fermentation transcriptional regulator [Companilactobacillus ginsenosidimutans]
MNFKDLRYFRKLTELKNYSETAHFFGVSQPTITYAIKRLENEYNCELIVRKSYANSVQLTSIGEQFLVHVQKILREDELTKKDIERFQSNDVVMGFPPIISDYLMPLVFDSLKEEKVLDKIRPKRSGSKELLDELHNGRIDISLAGTTHLPESGEYQYKVLKTHKFKIIASAQRDFPKELKIRDLENEDALVLDESSVHQLLAANLVEKYNVFTNVVYQTSDYKLLLDLVASNKGISFITETALKDVSGIQTLNVTDVDFPSFYLILIYRSSMKIDPTIQKLIDVFSDLSDN